MAPPDTPTGGSGSGDASVGGSDTSTPDPTMGEGETTGSVTTGCQKVDLLFVIDNGSTMGDEQEALIAAFPGFYDGLKATLGVQDMHVMAVAADDGLTRGDLDGGLFLSRNLDGDALGGTGLRLRLDGTARPLPEQALRHRGTSGGRGHERHRQQDRSRGARPARSRRPPVLHAPIIAARRPAVASTRGKSM